jgi:hypothetical protein
MQGNHFVDQLAFLSLERYAPGLWFVMVGHGSPLIVTLSYWATSDIRGKYIDIRDLPIGQRIAPRAKVRRKNHRTIAAADRSPKNGSSRSHEDEPNV